MVDKYTISKEAPMTALLLSLIFLLLCPMPKKLHLPDFEKMQSSCRIFIRPDAAVRPSAGNISTRPAAGDIQ